MTDAEVIERLAQGEDSRTQFKCGPIGIAHLSEELAAFANAQGGVIFFGVDDEGTPVGLSRSQKKTLEDELSNAANDGVRPALYPRTEFHTIGGKQVLAVFVPEGVSKPYADKKGAFWTKSGLDKRRITAREELQRLLQRSLLVHADELPVEKADIGEAKADIGTGKADIGTGKADIGETREGIALILSKLQSNTTERVQASTLNHVKCAYEAVSGKPFFKRSDIQVATGLAKTVASELLGRLLSLRIIVPVSGHGKGAYRFVEAGS